MSGAVLLPWVRPLAQILVVSTVAYLMWRSIDGLDVVALLRDAQPLWLLAAGALLTVQLIASALRWQITAARLGIDIPASVAVREYYLSQVVNQSLPGGVLGDAARAVRARRQAGLVAAGQAVVFERVAGQIGLLALLAIGLGVCAIAPDGPQWPPAVVIPALSGLALVTGGVIVASFQPPAPRRSAMGRMAQAFSKSVLARSVRWRQTGLSLLTAGCNIVAFALCVRAFGAPLSLATALTLIPLVLFAMVLPLSISGWGLREGAAVLLFPMAGLSAELGLTASIAFGLIFLATALPGLVFLRMRPIAPIHPS